MFNEYVFNYLRDAYNDENIKQVILVLDGFDLPILNYSIEYIHCEHPEDSNIEVIIPIEPKRLYMFKKVFK